MSSIAATSRRPQYKALGRRAILGVGEGVLPQCFIKKHKMFLECSKTHFDSVNADKRARPFWTTKRTITKICQ